MRFIKKLILLILLVQSFKAASVIAADSRIDELNARVEKESALLASFESEEQRLTQELSKISNEITILNKEQQRLESRLLSMREEKQTLDKELVKEEERLSYLKNLAYQRIRSLYMYSAESVRSVLLKVSSSESQQYALYLDRLREFDTRLIKDTLELQERISTKGKALQVVIKNISPVVASISKEKGNLDRKLKSQALIKKELEQKRRGQQDILTRLKAEALRLETVISSITNGDSTERPRVSQAELRPERLSGFEGLGIKGIKLVKPVRGKVVTRFGKSVNGSFKDIVINKGVQVKALSSEAVKAIAPAKVIFVGEMPGVGKVVILDHGKRHYSLYGRLASVLVERGAVLERGAALALLAESEEKSMNFYFEVRIAGKAIDPMTFFPSFA